MKRGGQLKDFWILHWYEMCACQMIVVGNKTKNAGSAQVETVPQLDTKLKQSLLLPNDLEEKPEPSHPPPPPTAPLPPPSRP